MHVKFLEIFSLDPAEPCVGYPEMADKAEILDSLELAVASYSFKITCNTREVCKCIISSITIGKR